MSRLNETYSEMVADVAKSLIPLMGKVNSKGLSPEALDMSKVVMQTMGLVGDLLETIDEMEARQKKTEAKINCLVEANNTLTRVIKDLLEQNEQILNEVDKRSRTSAKKKGDDE